eukprot:2159960-Amphidinium_carterae.1
MSNTIQDVQMLREGAPSSHPCNTVLSACAKATAMILKSFIMDLSAAKPENEVLLTATIER